MSSTVWCAAGLQVARHGDVEVHPAVAGQQVEHVVQEAHAGLARAAAVAVERQRELHVGLPRGAVDVSRPAHRASHSREPPWTLRDGGSPRRARSARPRPPARPPPRRSWTSLIRRRKVARRQPGGEARRAARRQRVVGARDVVAEGHGARARRRTRSRRCARAAPAPRPPAPTSSRCSGAKASAKASAASASGAETRTQAASPSPARSTAAPIASSSGASSLTAPTIVPSPCSAWARRSAATRSPRAPAVASTSRSLGP